MGEIATITIKLEGQEMFFLNGGPSQQLNPAFSFFIRCDSQEEIDRYWGKLIEGGKPMACGWLTDRFGLCWKIVLRNIGALIRHPKAMQAMMGMIKLDLPTLEAAAPRDLSALATQYQSERPPWLQTPAEVWVPVASS